MTAPNAPDALRFDAPTAETADPTGDGIIELPRFFVPETRLRIPSEEAVLTSRGVADIAMKRYISELDHALNRFTLPLFGTSREAHATAMYREDERLRKLKELGDLVGLLSLGNSSGAPRARREAARFSLR
ncbi:hypothetical protein [Opitutus sp. ER46]|uniref:hypothetical protein n=1 Tax=Opitutus sp. ER46 TaxID=2161864 RepID=UPI0011B20CC3|nr:hypothetical protein [Opitutus sp. ER46]